MTELTRHVYRFGPFQLDVLSSCLLRGGEPVGLTPKAFDLLLLLVKNRGRLLEKDELMRILWPDTFVEEANLTQYIFTIRKILGEQPDGRPYIDTVARRGYLFVAEVEEIVEPPVATKPSGPAQRTFPMTAQFLVAAVVVTALAGIGALYLRSRQSSGPPAPQPGARTLAVLPFRPLSRGPDDEYLALGMADTLITRLAQIRGLNVRPTSSVLRYERLAGDPLAAARELRVDSLLDGRFQRVGDRIRVSVQLLNTHDGSTIWADHFDQPFSDVFAVQDAISERVAHALEARLTREEQERFTRRHTENLEAYQLYLRGRYFWERRTAESLRKSIDYYQQAIAKDPMYALAYAGLADSYVILGNFNELSPNDEAIAEYRLGLAAYGKYSKGRDLGFLGLALARSRRTAEAREVLEGLQRKPGEYLSPYSEALVRIGLGEKAEALTLLERVVDERHPWIIHLNIEPSLDPLRNEPRFKALLRRIGIPEVTLRNAKDPVG